MLDIQFVLSTATEFEVAIRRWLISLKASGRSSGTCEQYRYHLDRCGRWLHDRAVAKPDELSRALLDEYVAELHDVWSSATIKQAVSALRSFASWLREERLIKKRLYKKLLKALSLPKVKSNTQRTLSIAEIEQLLAVCDLTTAKGTRDAALVGLLTDTGLRAAEVRRLQLGDVTFDVEIGPNVVVNRVQVQVKGGRVAVGYFGRRTADYVRDWLQLRDGVANDGNESLFVSVGGVTPGAALSQHGLKVILRKLGQKAGVDGVSPHPFRRAFACILEMAGASTRTIQELGRWEKLDMVLLYTRDYQAGLQYNRFSPMDYIDRVSSDPK